MLVLSRKTGEQIRIGKDIVVTVLVVAGGRVRLGISAPSEVRVVRSEIADPSANLADEGLIGQRSDGCEDRTHFGKRHLAQEGVELVA